jgi:RNAse (barnase) inhibitor barstar
MTVPIKVEALHTKLSHMFLLRLHFHNQLTLFDRLLNTDAAAPICICLGHANMRNTLTKFACMRNMREGEPLNSQ